VHIRLPVLPNGRTGWVRRSALGGYRFVHTRLVVDRTKLTATLFKNRQPIFHAPVGVGTPAAPTPAGEFYVRLKLAGFNDPFYGPVAYGTNARSTVLTDWPGGGYIGIHGTNMPELVPGRVSHGCIRMRNEDILKLSALMPVGTPLIVR
jgi:lipoprotein-anchoring transpeptidase ErfK/SrfK